MVAGLLTLTVLLQLFWWENHHEITIWVSNPKSCSLFGLKFLCYNLKNIRFTHHYIKSGHPAAFINFKPIRVLLDLNGVKQKPLVPKFQPIVFLFSRALMFQILHLHIWGPLKIMLKKMLFIIIKKTSLNLENVTCSFYENLFWI